MDPFAHYVRINMSVIKKILANWYYIFALLFGLDLFFTGIGRINAGRSFILLSDYATASYMGKGILYVELSLIILIVFTIGITLSLTEKKK